MAARNNPVGSGRARAAAAPAAKRRSSRPAARRWDWATTWAAAFACPATSAAFTASSRRRSACRASGSTRDAPRLRGDRHAAGADGAARRGPVAGAASAGRRLRRLRRRRCRAGDAAAIRPRCDVEQAARSPCWTDDGVFPAVAGDRSGPCAKRPRRCASAARRSSSFDPAKSSSCTRMSEMFRHVLQPGRRRRRRRRAAADARQHARLARRPA